MAADKITPKRPFGWQGIELALPADWELSAYDGDSRSGYARLDDGIQVRLHVQWNRERRPVDSLEPALEHYRKGLARKLNHQVEFNALAPDFLPATESRRVAAYSWTGKHSVVGVASFCPECHRVTFAEVFARGGKDEAKLARDILATLTDHGTNNETLWSVYGFAFRMPAPYTLGHPVLLPGRLQFPFQADSRRWIRVERWTLASPSLEALQMEAWPQELLRAARLQPVGGLVTRADTVNGLQACAFETRVSRGLLRKTDVRGLVWKNPGERKVFAVIAGQESPDMVRRIADGLQCY